MKFEGILPEPAKPTYVQLILDRAELEHLLAACNVAPYIELEEGYGIGVVKHDNMNKLLDTALRLLK